jgi:hypothetical protein
MPAEVVDQIDGRVVRPVGVVQDQEQAVARLGQLA